MWVLEAAEKSPVKHQTQKRKSLKKQVREQSP